MAELNEETRAVNARILYWGPEGSGKTTNLEVIHAKLRPDHRGELESVATGLDPSVTYEVMPIELGDLSGYRTRIQVVAVPGGALQAPTRKQLLDEVDGIVFVADARREALDTNVESFEELKTSLAAYGRSLEEVPLVVQYNKCDLGDPYTLEELHRKLETRSAAAFEAVATEGRAVLPSLTTISKRVIRALRETRPTQTPDLEPPEPAVEAPAPMPEPVAGLETALLADAEQASTADATARAAEEFLEASLADLDEASGHGFETALPLEDEALDVTRAVAMDAVVADGSLSIERVGEAEQVSERVVRIPLVLRDASGATHVLSLTLSVGDD